MSIKVDTTGCVITKTVRERNDVAVEEMSGHRIINVTLLFYAVRAPTAHR